MDNKENSIIRKRLKKTVKVLNNFDDFLQKTVGKIPGGFLISKDVLNNICKETKKLAKDLEQTRAPRFLLIGKTGVGKSSLINALVGEYVVPVSAVTACTKKAEIIKIEKDNEVILEFIDTRGVFESVGNSSVDKELAQNIADFTPDAVIFVFRAKDRGHLDLDIKLVKHILKKELNDIPLIVALSQVDELDPAREKLPENYSKEKINNINESLRQLKVILGREGLSYFDILPISSYIEWDFNKKDTGEIIFDGRYNIEMLLLILEKNIDLHAQIGLLLCTRSNAALKKIALLLANAMSKAASAIALTPIPIADIFPLLVLQLSMVTLIMYLSGRDADFDGAKDFMMSLGFIGLGGYAFRAFARQVLKVIPLPFLGDMVSAGVAYTGTMALGKAAIAYCFDDIKDVDKLKGMIKKEMEEGAGHEK